MVSMKEVLQVLREFHPLEPSGVPVGLIAWELYERDAWIAELIELARERGLVEISGADGRSGEALWRLTPSGSSMVAEGGDPEAAERTADPEPDPDVPDG
jgi:hypothetical protein